MPAAQIVLAHIGARIEVLSGDDALAMAMHDARFPQFLLNERDKRVRVNRAVDLVEGEARHETLAAPFEQRVDNETLSDHDQRLINALGTGGDPTKRHDDDFKQVDAADYGVPHVRWRVVLIGLSKNLSVSRRFPDATHSAGALMRSRGVTRTGPR